MERVDVGGAPPARLPTGRASVTLFDRIAAWVAGGNRIWEFGVISGESGQVDRMG